MTTRNGWEVYCARCGSDLRRTSSTMSKFNTDIICAQCADEEENAPGFAAACAAEEAQCRAGNYNYKGVGLSPADRVFLTDARARRTP